MTRAVHTPAEVLVVVMELLLQGYVTPFGLVEKGLEAEPAQSTRCTRVMASSPFHQRASRCSGASSEIQPPVWCRLSSHCQSFRR